MRGERIVLPLTVTRNAELLAGAFGVEVTRTKVSLPALALAATEPGVVFAGSLGGGYIFPSFLPAFDAVMSLGKLLELLAPQAQPLSEQVAEIPSSTLVHKTVPCPWSLKGTVMRTATEVLQREAQSSDGAPRSASWTASRCAAPTAGCSSCPTPTSPCSTCTPRARTARQSEQLAQSFLDVVRTVIDENSA